MEREEVALIRKLQGLDFIRKQLKRRAKRRKGSKKGKEATTMKPEKHEHWRVGFTLNKKSKAKLFFPQKYRKESARQTGKAITREEAIEKSRFDALGTYFEIRCFRFEIRCFVSMSYVDLIYLLKIK